MKKFIKTIFIFTLFLGVIKVSSYKKINAENEFSGETVTIGVASDYEEDVWNIVAEIAAEDDVNVEVVLFNDYIQPNVALQDGSIDLNAFQHVDFLNEWNAANEGELIALGYTYIAPMRIYSEKIKELSELEKGAQVGIPDDPTNGGRALKTLELAGLIKLDENAGGLPTVRDIIENEFDLDIVELEAAQLPHSLADLALAVINNNYANDAELSEETILFSDSDNVEKIAAEYKNIVAAHSDNADSALFKYIVDIYQSKPIADKLAELSGDSDIPAWSQDDKYPLELQDVSDN